MAKVGQYIVTYSNGDDQDYSDSNQANALRIGFEVLHQFENWDKYDKAMDAYQYIDEIVSEERKTVFRLHRHGLKKSNMSRSSMSLHPVELWSCIFHVLLSFHGDAVEACCVPAYG